MTPAMSALNTRKPRVASVAWASSQTIAIDPRLRAPRSAQVM